MKKETSISKPGTAFNRFIYNNLLFLLWVIALTVFAVLHVKFILYDSDYFVSKSGFWLTDEGHYAYNAISMLRYGKALVPDDFNTIMQCPVLSIFQYLFFSIFGISIFASRIQGLIAFIIGNLLFAYFWKKEHLFKAGLLTLILMSCNYLIFATNRTSAAEIYTCVYLGLCTIVLFRMQEYRIRNVLLGILSITATLTKPSLIVFPLGLIFYTIIITIIERRKPLDYLKENSFFWGTMIAISTPIILFWIIPHFNEWKLFTANVTPISMSTDITGNLLQFFRVQINIPFSAVLFVYTLMTLPLLIKNVVEKKVSRLDRLQIWGWSVALFQFLSVGTNSYQTERYFSAFSWTWGIIIAASLPGLLEMYTKKSSQILVTIYKLAIGAAITTSYFNSNRVLEQFRFNIGDTSAVDAIVVGSLVLFLIFNVIHNKYSGKLSIAIISFLLTLSCLFVFICSFRNWQRHTSLSFYNAIMDIHQRLPAHCTIMGHMAGMIALEHPCHTYWAPSAINEKNPLPEYAILREKRDIRDWIKENPAIENRFVNQLVFLAEYKIMNNYYKGDNTTLLAVKKNTVQ